MLRSPVLLVLGLLFVVAGCAALNEDQAPPENLLPLSTLPAEYGELVTVLHYENDSGPLIWDELWFENEDTGLITRVAVYRPTWSYDPSRIRQIQLVPTAAAAGEEE